MITTAERQKVDAATATVNDPRWARVVARDRSADGKFWYSVATTGVYCRPSCPSRGANPKNVAFHDTLAGAVGLSASYFHRLFKATTGLTPKDYAAAHRASRVREELTKGHTVT